MQRAVVFEVSTNSTHIAPVMGSFNVAPSPIRQDQISLASPHVSAQENNVPTF